MPARQYPAVKDMTLIQRLKIVAKLRARGYSRQRIATELDYDVRTASKDYAAVENRYKDMDDFDSYLRDVTERTREQLQKLNELEATIWRQLDWAKEWVIQTDQFGNPIHEIGEDGMPKSDDWQYGPRKPNMVTQLVNQIQAINKQQAELLGILNKNVDITVKLQQAEQTQIVMLEAIQGADPQLYATLRRQIQAVRATVGQVALPAPREDAIDAEYIEEEHEIA